MRKGLRLLAPFAILMGIHTACSATDARSGFSVPDEPHEGGSPAPFETVDASTDAQGCSETTTEILRIPVVIEFAVDESGSMDGTGAGNKWGAARDALLGAFEDMQKTADPGMFVGLLRWSTDVGQQVSPGPMTDKQHYDQLFQTINTAKANGGGTDMMKGLAGAYQAVEGFTPPAGFVTTDMHRAVVLVSDGSPAASDKPMCVSLAADKLKGLPPKGPVLTFAVGIGPFPTSSSYGYDPAFMGQIAQNGGTAPASCNPTSSNAADVCHFQITPAGADSNSAKQALVDALDKIRVVTATCDFAFTTTAETDLGNVRVEITDETGTKSEVPKDDENGWAFDDPKNPTKVVLHGDACTKSKVSASAKIGVVLGCKTAH